MAKEKTNSLVNSLSGKINKKEPISHRNRFGKQEVYDPQQKDQRAPMTEPQAASAKAFGNLSTLASCILRDPQASAQFRADYLQLDQKHRPQILYRYILSSLNSDPTLVTQFQYLLSQKH